MRGVTPISIPWVRPFYGRSAALCLPAMPLLLAAGLASGHEALAAVAAGAAFSVGFGASRGLRGRRWGAMAAAVLGITLAAFVGSLAGGSMALYVLLAALTAGGCAALATSDDDLWWVMLQVAITLIVAGYYAGTPHAALQRAGVTAAGGATQLALVWLLARRFPGAAAPLPGGPARPPLARGVRLETGVRAGLCVASTLLIAEALGLSNSYWAPMTALIVLKPSLVETRVRGGARLVGTLVGGAAATLFVLLVHGEAWALVAGLAATAGTAFALQKAHYAALTAAVTATVVLLLSIGGSSVVANVEHRLAATVLGGLVALAVSAVPRVGGSD